VNRPAEEVTRPVISPTARSFGFSLLISTGDSLGALRLRGKRFSSHMKASLRQMAPDQEGKLKAALSEIGVLE